MSDASTSARSVVLLVSAVLPVLVSASSALAQGPAVEKCRETVGRPIVQACMQAGGNMAACREKASPRVRACVQAAMGGGGARSAGAEKRGGSGGGEQRGGPLVGKARQLVMSGQFDPALDLLNKAIAQDPNSSSAYMWRGILRQRLGRYAEAQPDFDKSVQLNGRNAWALAGRGYNFYLLNDKARALEDSNAASNLDAEIPGPYATRGLILSDEGNLTKAVEELNRSIKLDERYIPAYIGLGIVYVKQQEFEKAIAAYSKAIATNPKNFGIRNGRGFAYQSIGDNDRALADFNDALKINPRFTRTYVNRGRIYIEKGDLDAAIKDFDVAIQQRSDNIPALLQRARAYELKRDADKAKADYRTVLTTAPTHPVAVAGIERIEARQAGRPADGATGSGGRVALVVGNSKYKTFDALANPERDARLIASTFEKSGFRSVQLVLDASKDELALAMKTFAKEATQADWAVIYFAGHGIELDGSNYLVPVDAKYEKDADIPVESVALDQALNAVNGASRMRLVILDACRENPFGADKKGDASNAGRGLARIEPESGTLVAFATKHGHLASDGGTGNSPFANSLAKRIDSPGIEINRLFRLVHDDVYNATGKKQEPFTYGQLTAEEFYFRPR